MRFGYGPSHRRPAGKRGPTGCCWTGCIQQSKVSPRVWRSRPAFGFKPAVSADCVLSWLLTAQVCQDQPGGGWWATHRGGEGAGTGTCLCVCVTGSMCPCGAQHPEPVACMWRLTAWLAAWTGGDMTSVLSAHRCAINPAVL